jgi:hypothetical protein
VRSSRFLHGNIEPECLDTQENHVQRSIKLVTTLESVKAPDSAAAVLHSPSGHHRRQRSTTDTENDKNGVAGCISNVECSVCGNLELRQTIASFHGKFLS